jgi:hypothetical protein
MCCERFATAGVGMLCAVVAVWIIMQKGAFAHLIVYLKEGALQHEGCVLLQQVRSATRC